MWFDYHSLLQFVPEVEGNSLSKISQGGVNALVEASILSLYDKERLQGPKKEGQDITWEDLDKETVAAFNAAEAAGQKIVLVANTIISPTFKKAIAEFQAVQWMLADMATELYAMKTMVYDAAWRLDQGARNRARAGMVKLFCTEAVGRIADRAVQIHGGMGYMEEAPIESVYREVRGMRIFEGTSEIQRLIIARDVLKDGLKCLDYD